MKKILPDILLVAGAASVSAGAWMAWPPAGYLVAGVMAMVAGIKIASVN